MKKIRKGYVPHVWSRDPALDIREPDIAAEAFKKFKKSGDLDELKLMPDRKPVVFHLARLERKYLLQIGDMPTSVRADCEAVALSLRKIDGLMECDGEPVVLTFDDIGDGNQKLHPATLDKLYDDQLFAELARRALEISRIDPT